MANGQLRAAVNQLRHLMGRQRGCTLTDAQLLEDFVNRRDEAAFEVLVWRHGIMVLTLCQRVLRNSHEAEDAFQATFLVLARKAASIGKREAVGSWLYKVAYRVALNLRARAVPCDARQELVEDLPAPERGEELLWRDLRPVLDQEIDRLPEKYRLPFVLCYLEGQTNEEAARQLGCPKGTILSRLARGRERLRSRLTQRGLALSAAGLVTVLSQEASSAAVPAVLVSSTTKAATLFAAGQAATELLSASVVALTEGVLHTMFLTKVKITTAALLALTLLGTGTGWLTHQALGQKAESGQRDNPARRADQDADAQRAQRSPEAPVLQGQVAAVASDGKSFTLVLPATVRGQETEKREVKIADKTAVTYHGVGLDGARPTEGYGARVQFEDGTKDLASRVTFLGKAAFRGPDVAGKVISVAKDGNGFTLEVPAPRDPAEEPKKIDVRLNTGTVLIYSNVPRGGAKLTEGYGVRIWWGDGPNGSSPASVHLIGPEGERGRGTGRPPEADVTGKVVGLTNDGKTITLERRVRGQEPEKVEIQLGDKTAVLFQNVGPDGTTVAEGLQARVWLEVGSKDRAAKVSFVGQVSEKDPWIGGKIVGVAADGKGFTLELPIHQRGEEAKRIEVKLTDKTQVVFVGVGPNGAKPTEGYEARIRLDSAAKDTAVQVQLGQPGRDRRR
jgi:RNA polymerase sigma factor (sigma-70 family)